MVGNPRLSFATLKAIASVIMGDTPLWRDQPVSPHRTHARLNEFFADELQLTPTAVPDGSRKDKTHGWLKLYNGTADLRRIVEASVQPVHYVNSGCEVDGAVSLLNEHLALDGFRLVTGAKGFKLQPTTGVVIEASPEPVSVLSAEYIREVAEKCDDRLSAGDHEGAITVSRTLLEAVLVALEEALTGAHGDYKGDLPKQFKHVSKLLRMDDERPDLDDRFKDVVRGLVMVANGLAPLRNKMSDGHARERKPAPHHARVVVNAAKTVATFLIESYVFQKNKGLVPALPTSGRPHARL